MRIEEFTKTSAGKVAKVHDPCTIHYYSDAEPAEVVQVTKSGKTIFIRALKTEVDPNSKGEMGHQDWVWKEGDFVKIREYFDKKTGEYVEFDTPQLSPEPDNYSFFKATLRKDGCYRTVGSNLFVQIGISRKYYCWEM